MYDSPAKSNSIQKTQHAINIPRAFENTLVVPIPEWSQKNFKIGSKSLNSSKQWNEGSTTPYPRKHVTKNYLTNIHDMHNSPSQQDEGMLNLWHPFG